MRSYQQAIQALNSLQSNAMTLEKIRNSKLLYDNAIPEFKAYVTRIGYQVQDLNRMNIIHITGTKGKGSTGAFIESALKRAKIGSSPLKVGLFTSPHIFQVRERIRINGKPISQELFAKYFFQVWDRLDSTSEGDKPAYFRYLTLVCFHACMQEKVDTLILEVGIGGEYDSTNVIEKPTCSVITSIGLDHVALLGDTEAKIAWHKSGIIKAGCPCVVAPQLDSVIKVIKDRSVEKKCSELVFISTEYVESVPPKLGLAGEHQKINAAVAIQAIKEHLISMKLINISIDLKAVDIELGLREAFWPGRCQRVKVFDYPDAEWFLDGAHTPESLKVCTEWFKSETLEDDRQKVLIFNCTHSRMGKDLFPPVIESGIEFSKVIFCRNEPFTKLCVQVNSKTIRIKLNALINTIMPQIRSEKLHFGIEGILTHLLTELSSYDILDNPEEKFSNLLHLIIHSTISPDLINACFILARSVQYPDYFSHLLVISTKLERLLISERESTRNQLPLIEFLFKLMKLWNYCEIFGELSISLMLQSDEIEIQNFACKILSFKIKEYSIQKLRDSSILNLVLECYRRVFIINNNHIMYFLPLNNALAKKNAVGGQLESIKCQDLAVIIAQQLDGTNNLQTLASCMCALFNICLADPDCDSVFENLSYVETAINSALNIYSPSNNSGLITIILHESKAKYAEFSEVFTKTTIRYLALCLNHGKSVLLQNPRIFQSFMTCIAKNLDSISDSIDEFLELLLVILKSSPICLYQLLDSSSLVDIAIESAGAESEKSRLAAIEVLATFLRGSKMYFNQGQKSKLCTELMKSLELQSTEHEFSASQQCFLILMFEVSLSDELLSELIIPRLELALNFSARRPIWVFRALDILCSKYLNLRVTNIKKEKLPMSRMLQVATECIFSATLRTELKPTIQFLQNYSSDTEVQHAILDQYRKFGAKSILGYCIERFRSEIDDLWTSVVELLTQISLNEELAMQISRINILSGQITHTLLRQKRYEVLNGALELCINLSKSYNGQTSLLKNSGFLDSVISIVTVPNQQVQLSALILLSSLMRFKDHKTYLFANENFYANIAFIIESNHASTRHSALQLVWILIYNCEKAKVCLKQSKLYPQLLNLTKKEKNKDGNLEEQQALSAINELLH